MNVPEGTPAFRIISTCPLFPQLEFVVFIETIEKAFGVIKDVEFVKASILETSQINKLKMNQN